MKFVVHYVNKKAKRSPFPCSERFGWNYQPRCWSENPEEVTCKRCQQILEKWGKLKNNKKENITMKYFIDGTEIDASGIFRIVGIKGDWYVIGEGMLEYCESEEEADNLLKKLKGETTMTKKSKKEKMTLATVKTGKTKTNNKKEKETMTTTAPAKIQVGTGEVRNLDKIIGNTNADNVDVPEIETDKIETPEIDTPKKETKPKKEKVVKPKKEKKEKVKKETKPGVIKTIVELIETAGKDGITKEEIHTNLVKTFPERNPESMKKTINVQVPARITKEKFKVEKTEAGKYYKV